MNRLIVSLSKRLMVMFTMALLLFSVNIIKLTANANVTFSIPSPSEEFYIYDDTASVSSEDKQFITDWGQYLNTNYGAQPVVVIVNSASPEIIDIETYTDQLMRAWNVGGTSGYGIVLVMDVTADDYYCVSGDALKSHFSSGTIQTILDEQVEPSFAAGSYSTAAKNFINTVANDLNTYMPENGISAAPAAAVDTQAAPSETTVDAPESSSGGIATLLKIILIAILVLIIICCFGFVAIFMHGQKIKKQREEQRRRREAQARRSVQQRSSNVYARPVRTQSGINSVTTRPVSQRVQTRPVSTRPQSRSSSAESDSYREFMNNYTNRK